MTFVWPYVSRVIDCTVYDLKICKNTLYLPLMSAPSIAFYVPWRNILMLKFKRTKKHATNRELTL